MAAVLFSSLFTLAGLFTLWPAVVVEVLRDHTVLILVALVLVGVAAEAVLTVIRATENARHDPTTQTDGSAL
ncbi:MAG: hypothetical protein ABIS86_00265 [Streptosporangiaceae bacterium]